MEAKEKPPKEVRDRVARLTTNIISSRSLQQELVRAFFHLRKLAKNLSNHFYSEDADMQENEERYHATNEIHNVEHYLLHALDYSVEVLNTCGNTGDICHCQKEKAEKPSVKT